jgi:catechol 2,3-dioxygenase-like lactoylglutathione lyase family enzyme
LLGTDGGQNQGVRYRAPMPRAGRLQVTFDCADPAALGVFWAEVLGYPRPDVDAWHEVLRSQGRAEPELNATFAIEDPEGRRPRLFFQRVPEAKVAKNRVHLDIAAPADQPGERRDQVDSYVERLVSVGARVLRPVTEDGPYFVAMADPEGNEFCVD